MQNVSPAIAGANYDSSQPLTFSINAAGGGFVTKTVVNGSYLVWCSVDFYIRTDGGDVAAPGNTQGGTPSGTMPFPAGIPIAVDVEHAKISVIAIGAAGGSCYVGGPVHAGPRANTR